MTEKPLFEHRKRHCNQERQRCQQQKERHLQQERDQHFQQWMNFKIMNNSSGGTLNENDTVGNLRMQELWSRSLLDQLAFHISERCICSTFIMHALLSLLLLSKMKWSCSDMP